MNSTAPKLSVYTKYDQALEEIHSLRQRITRLKEALVGMHPANRSPTCFCPSYYDTDRLGHASECIKAIAALQEDSRCEFPLPQRGEVWEHHDGGTLYVLRATDKTVTVQRRPFGDSLADPYTITLMAFRGLTTGRRV